MFLISFNLIEAWKISYSLIREFMHQNSNLCYSLCFDGQLFRKDTRSNITPTGSYCITPYGSQEQIVLFFFF